jgi:hypothetical protein
VLSYIQSEAGDSLCKTVEQTTSASTVLGIIFQNVSTGNNLKDLIQGNILLNRLLLGMLDNTNVLRCSLDLDTLQYSFQIGDIKLAHCPYARTPITLS